MWYIIPHTKTKIIAHVHAAHGHTGTRADFFFGMYQLETRFARIINTFSLSSLSPGHGCGPKGLPFVIRNIRTWYVVPDILQLPLLFVSLLFCRDSGVDDRSIKAVTVLA